VLPRNFDVADYQADLAALRPVIVRLQRVYDRLIDSEMALGSDLMVASLEGYAHLKVAGQADGLDTLRQALGARFDRRRRTADEAAPAQ
jgi:hypothetical protein